MGLSVFPFVFDDPFPGVVGGVLIVVPVVSFLIFLWLFRVKHVVIQKNIFCPYEERNATVELTAQEGQTGSYDDVRSCSLYECEEGPTCHRNCRTLPTVLEAPFIAVRRQ